jgi:hypothetical protein
MATEMQLDAIEGGTVKIQALSELSQNNYV